MKLSKYIKEVKTNAGIVLRSMNIRKSGVITIVGSFPAGSLFSPRKNPMLADITAKMLSEGTIEKTKQELAQALEKLGAEISFTTSAYYTRFKAECRKEHIEKVLELIVEQLNNPTFPQKQLEKIKKQLISSLEQDVENTRSRAIGELSRMLYKSGGPNYIYPIEEKIDFVKKTSVKDLKDFHKKYYDRGKLKLAIAGAVSEHINKKAIKILKELPLKPNSTYPITKDNQVSKIQKKQAFINISEKESADIYFGQALQINKDHKDYYPLFIASTILGFGFMGRLMKNVRNKKGLTYGTAAGLKGFDDMQKGYLIALGMFAPQLIKQGIDAIKEEIEKLIEKGVTQKEVKEQKAHIIGTYKLSLANTNALADKMLKDLEDGKDAQYIDKFAEKIDVVTKKQVDEAIKKHLDIEKTAMAAAGTIKKM